MTITELPCDHCKEAKRETKYLVELLNTTRRQRLKVRVCPYCDGPELLRLAGKPNNVT